LRLVARQQIEAGEISLSGKAPATLRENDSFPGNISAVVPVIPGEWSNQ